MRLSTTCPFDGQRPIHKKSMTCKIMRKDMGTGAGDEKKK
jgi:hypothetical protein